MGQQWSKIWFSQITQKNLHRTLTRPCQGPVTDQTLPPFETQGISKVDFGRFWASGEGVWGRWEHVLTPRMPENRLSGLGAQFWGDLGKSNFRPFLTHFDHPDPYSDPTPGYRFFAKNPHFWRIFECFRHFWTPGSFSARSALSFKVQTPLLFRNLKFGHFW